MKGCGLDIHARHELGWAGTAAANLDASVE